TILRLGDRAHFNQLRSLAKKHLNSELRTAKFGAGYLAPCPTIRRSLPVFPGGLNRSTQHFILKKRWSVAMERRFRRGFTAAGKTELWDRWKRGGRVKG